VSGRGTNRWTQVHATYELSCTSGHTHTHTHTQRNGTLHASALTVSDLPISLSNKPSRKVMSRARRKDAHTHTHSHTHQHIRHARAQYHEHFSSTTLCYSHLRMDHCAANRCSNNAILWFIRRSVGLNSLQARCMCNTQDKHTQDKATHTPHDLRSRFEPTSSLPPVSGEL
jgi:hypothetical protein